jgi:Domain of unknown function (DUF4276)
VKIGLVVDGFAEFYSLPLLRIELEQNSGHQLIGPVKAEIQPTAPLPQIARSCLPSISILGAKGAKKTIVLFDREDRQECPGDLAQAVTEILRSKFRVGANVVVKDSKFENWLIADVEALKHQNKRFRVSRTMESAVVPNKADTIDALRMLKDAAQGREFSKVLDARRICDVATIDEIAANSRSFRRFLRVFGYEDYKGQSRRPLST